MPTYHITVTPGGVDSKVERLIRAPNRATALRKVTEDSITIAEADVDTVHRLAREDVQIEVAAGEPATVPA